MVAIALQPNAMPAPSIVIAAQCRPSRLKAYGTRLASASATSTSVIVSSWELCVELRGGAHRAAPRTPVRIAAIAMYS